MPAPTIGNSQTDYRTRAIIARIGLTANTPKEAVYYQGTVGQQRPAVDGREEIHDHLKQTPLSLLRGSGRSTMYDASNYYTVPNPINRYLLGRRIRQ